MRERFVDELPGVFGKKRGLLFFGPSLRCKGGESLLYFSFKSSMPQETRAGDDGEGVGLLGFLGREGPLSEERARLLNPLQLAFVGDTVFDLYVRSHLLWREPGQLRQRVLLIRQQSGNHHQRPGLIRDLIHPDPGDHPGRIML